MKKILDACIILGIWLSFQISHYIAKELPFINKIDLPAPTAFFVSDARLYFSLFAAIGLSIVIVYMGLRKNETQIRFAQVVVLLLLVSYLIFCLVSVSLPFMPIV